MNTKNNRRAQTTDEAIIREVYAIIWTERRPISKITVREICERANINRSTFYAHYQDIWDVVERVEAQMAKQAGNAYLSQVHRSLESAFESLFSFLAEYRQFYLLYFAERQTASIFLLIDPVYQEKEKQLTPELLGYTLKGEREYHYEFFLGGLTALVRRWLKNDCKETPRELVEILQREYSPRLELFRWEND